MIIIDLYRINAGLHLFLNNFGIYMSKLNMKKRGMTVTSVNIKSNKPGILSIHKKTRHYGFKYIYNQCDSQHGNYYKLWTHKKSLTIKP